MTLIAAQPGVQTALPPELPANAGPATRPAPAGFWVRALAHLIDSALFSMILTPILLAFVMGDVIEMAIQAKENPSAADPFAVMETLQGPAGLIIQYVLPAIAVILLWRWRSATPGKMLLKLVIVDADHLGKPSTGQLITRFFGYLVSMLPLCLGFFAIGWDARRQGWHDKLARTLVVRTPS